MERKSFIKISFMLTTCLLLVTSFVFSRVPPTESSIIPDVSSTGFSVASGHLQNNNVVDVFTYDTSKDLDPSWTTNSSKSWYDGEYPFISPSFTSFSPGGSSWENLRVQAGSVLFIDGIYKMWYSGYNGTNWQIGYATSPDGANWTPYASNPVLTNISVWSSVHVYDPSVIYDPSFPEGERYKMWYSGYGSTAPNNKWQIGYATSPDGITWTPHASNPRLTTSSGWSSVHVYAPSVIYDPSFPEGARYKMWYSGYSTKYQIGYTTSPDGITWTPYAGNPVFSTGSGNPWDTGQVTTPSVSFREGSYEMWYAGGNIPTSGPTLYRIGHVTSTDGVNWVNRQKSSGIVEEGINPAVLHKEDGSRSIYFSSGTVSGVYTFIKNAVYELKKVVGPFPSKARIVASEGRNISIIDADNNVWMVITSYISMLSSNISSIYALNGRLYIGMDRRLVIFDFKNDKIIRMDSGQSVSYTGGIADFGRLGYTISTSQPTFPLLVNKDTTASQIADIVRGVTGAIINGVGKIAITVRSTHGRDFVSIYTQTDTGLGLSYQTTASTYINTEYNYLGPDAVGIDKFGKCHLTSSGVIYVPATRYNSVGSGGAPYYTTLYMKTDILNYSGWNPHTNGGAERQLLLASNRSRTTIQNYFLGGSNNTISGGIAVIENTGHSCPGSDTVMVATDAGGITALENCISDYNLTNYKYWTNNATIPSPFGTPTIYNILNSNSVSALASDGSHLWLGQNTTGLAEIDLSNPGQRVYYSTVSSPAIASNTIKALSYGSLLVGTDNGASLLTTTTSSEPEKEVLYVGGDFTTAGGKPSSYIAKLLLEETSTPPPPVGDNISPIINITSPASNNSNTPIDVVFTVTDDTAISSGGVSVSGVEYSNFSCIPEGTPVTTLNCSIRVLESGTLNIKAVDAAENEANLSVSYFIDEREPVTTLSTDCTIYGNDPWCKNASVNVTINGDDGIDGSGIDKIYYKIGGDPGDPSGWIEFSSEFEVNTPGQTVIYHYATDKAGNYSDPVGSSVYIDGQAPSAPTISPASGIYNNGTPTAPLVVSWGEIVDSESGLSKYHVCRSAGPYGTSDFEETCWDINELSFQETGLTEGHIYKYKVKAIDVAGNESIYSNEIEIVIDRTVPEAPSISCITASGNYPWSIGDGKITWGTPSVGAGLSISNYYLYRNSGLWGTSVDDPFDYPANTNLYQTISSSSNQYIEPGLLTNETIYKYQVNAHDSAFPTPNVGDPSGVCEIIVDNESPFTTVSTRTPADPNSDDWYRVDVSFDLSVIDNLSGVDSNYPEYSLNGGAWVSAPSTLFTISNESATNTLQVRSKDRAGNIEDAVDIYILASPLKIDKTDPVANNHIASLSDLDLTISLNGVDATSGIKEVTSRIYDVSSGSKVEVIGSPISLSMTSGNSNNGVWSGVYTFSGEVTGLFVVDTTLVDYADNEFTVYTFGDPLSVDNIPPAIIINSPTKTSKGNILDTTITVTDAGGISASKVSITSSTVGTTSFNCQNVGDNPNEVSCTVIITSTPNEFNTANNKLIVKAIDNADNSNTVTEFGYLIDGIAPTVNLSFNPPVPNGIGSWYISDVTATITASDSGGAGLNKVYYKVVTNGSIPANFTEVSASSLPININIPTEGSTYILYYADDSFGNESSPKPAQSSIVNIDKTNPGATSFNNTSGITTKLGGSTNPPIILSWEASSDPGTYASGLYGYNIYRDGPGGFMGLFSDTITLEQSGLADGVYTYRIAPVDNAGRQGTMSAEITITIDTTSPLPTDVSCLPWINTDTNNLVWPEATDISGINRHEIDRDPVFTPTNPVPVDMPTLSYSDSPLVDETSYTYRVRGVDFPDNTGSYGNACTTKVDMTPPETTSNISGTAGNDGWYRGGISLLLSTIDPGVIASGVYISEYKLDDGSFTNFTSPINISSEGIVSIHYRSEDHAGNIEEAGVFELKIDNTAPSISPFIQSYDTGTDELGIVVGVFDELSGVQSVSMKLENGGGDVAGPFDLDYDPDSGRWVTTRVIPGLSGNYNIVYTATDYAGNENILYSPAALGVVSANIAPEINYTNQPSQTVGTGLVFFTFSIKDDDGDNITVTPTLVGGPSCSMSSLTTVTPGVSIGIGTISISGVSSATKGVSITWDAKADCGGNYDDSLTIMLVANDSQSTDTIESVPFSIDTKNPDLPVSNSDFNLLIKDTTANSVTLELGPNGLSDDNSLIYKIFFKEGTSGVDPSTSTPVTPSPFITSYVSGTPYLVDGLSPDTDYVFNIYGYDSYGNLTSATEVTTKTGSTTSYQPEPSLLSIEVKGYEQDEPVDGETTNIPAEDNVINFGETESGESRLSALTIDGFTNYGAGYSLFVYQNHDLRNTDGDTISKFDANTGNPISNSDPVPWVSTTGVGYLGYSTTSLERFNSTPRKYAAFGEIENQGIIAEHNTSGEHSDSLILKVEIGPEIKPGVYSNTITIVAVPNLQ